LLHLPTLAGLTRRRRLVAAALALVVIGLVSWATFELAMHAAVGETGQQAQRRLALFDRTLEAMVERFHYLPATISQAEEVHRLLEGGLDPAATEAANGFLSRLNETAGADELFVMDNDGGVAAASNWWTLESLVGRNFSFRPYFAQAMKNGDAKFYAFGMATNVPGYFLSRRIDGPAGPLGVAVAKINLGEIEANWWRSGELIGIVDVNEVVILSTRPDWRYRPLEMLDPQKAVQIATQQRYGNNGIINRGIVTTRWRALGAEFASIEGTDPETAGQFLIKELRLPTHGWRIISFTPMGALVSTALTASAAAGLGCAALLLVVLLVIQRRRIVAARLAEHDRLEQRVAIRTAELNAANLELREQIAERQRAEKDRRDAQEGLVQAAKLASLGQALAGVAHEVSQPVAALATHVASARLLASRSGDAEVGAVLGTMDKVISRLTALTGHLKTFARKETNITITSDLVEIIHNALELAEHKLKAFDVAVDFAPPAGAIFVRGNPIQLEQVLLNLFSNAADAMEHSAVRRLGVAVETPADAAILTVSDTGQGIPPADLPNLFDPFFTTKQAGRGLGLGLSISYGLVRDMGGSIRVASTLGEGSIFTVTLPLASHAASIHEEENA
jgi:C4-dicarboxylate-specific signal transduction histidine kinase